MSASAPHGTAGGAIRESGSDARPSVARGGAEGLPA